MVSYDEPKYEKWSIKELATPYYGSVPEDSAKALTLPKYQRNFVWSNKKRKELIDSIRRGFPIGTLIVRKVDEKTTIQRIDGHPIAADTFELLDGLQRSTTLLLHRLNFLELIEASDVDETLRKSGLNPIELSDACNEISQIVPEVSEVGEVLATWMKNCSVPVNFASPEGTTTYTVRMFDESLFDSLGLLDALATNWNTGLEAIKNGLQERKLFEKLSKLPGLVRQEFDIRNRKIPVIVWEGDDTGAARIFERVNQGGVKLNRYQSLAASWYNSKTDISSKTEIGKLAHEALSTPSGGAVVEKQSNKSEELDLYEALVGISEQLAKGYPFLFPPASKPQKAEEGLSPIEKQGVNYYAFNIAALSLKIKINDLIDVKKMLESKSTGDLIEVKKLASIIDTSAAKVANALKSLQYANAENSAGHTEAGMAAMVAALCVYQLNGGTLNKLSERNIRQHYLLDLISGLDAKGHATDIAAYSRVWENSDQDPTPTMRYTSPCPTEELESALDFYWQKEKLKAIFTGQTLRPRIDNVQKAVLRLYLGGKANYAAITGSENHHIDHVVPFKKGSQWLEKASRPIFIGAVTNLAFLPPKLNLSKGQLTLDAWFTNTGKAGEKKVREEILSNYSIEEIWTLVAAEPGESKVLDSKFATNSHLAESYEVLQEAIWERMKNKFLEVS